MNGSSRQKRLIDEMASVNKTGPKAVFKQAMGDFGALKLTKYGIRPLIVLFVIDFFQGFDSSIATLFAPEIRKEFNVTLTQLMLIGQLTSIPFLFAAPYIGFLADRFKRTYLVGISAVLSGVFSVISSFTGGIVSYQFSRAVDSVSEQLGDVPGNSLNLDYYPVEARAKVVSVKKFIGTLLGSSVGVLAGLLAAYLGWRSAMRFFAVPLIISGVLVIGLKEPIRGYWERLRAGEDEESASIEAPSVSAGEAIRILFASKTLRRMFVILPVNLLGAQGFGLLYQFYLVEQFRLSPVERQLLGIPGTIFGVVAVLLGAAYADIIIKRDASRILIYTAWISLASTFSQILIIFIPQLWLLIALGIVTGSAGAILAPAQYAVTSLVINPRLRGFGLGIVALLFIPLIPFSTIPAYIADTYGVRAGLMIFTPFTIVGALLQFSTARFFRADMQNTIAAAAAMNEYNRAKASGNLKLLVCRGVNVEFDGVKVLFGVDFDVNAGETVALLGTNGAGKSTLLRAIAGVHAVSDGAIVYEGRDITRLPPHEITRLGIVQMPGGKAVFPDLTVEENLDVARLGVADDVDAGERLERVYEFFPVLKDRLSSKAGTLSGGEQQMVGLAQAFLWQPKLLLIDELSLGLSPVVVASLLDIVRAINEEGTTVVVVEQSVNVALTVAERAVFMEKGEVKFDGPTAELLARPDIIRAVYVKGSSALGTSVSAKFQPTEGRVLLRAEGISKTFGGVRALNNATFELKEGQAVGFIGPNGAGKTTLFDVVSGYLPPDTGQIIFDENDITKLPAHKRGDLGIIRRFQDARLFASLTVLETLCVALDRKLSARSPFMTALGLKSIRDSEARVRRRAEKLIETLGLEAFRDKFVGELSTGSRRIVDMGCVLASEPRVLMLDEPSSGIAQAEAEGLGPLIRRIVTETGCSVLVIEHDMTLIRAISDELVAMVAGEVIMQAPPDEVLSDPRIVAAYLGEKEETVKRSGVLK